MPDNAEFCFNFANNDSNLTTHDVVLEGDSRPSPNYARGVYFDGNDVLSLQHNDGNFTLGPIFTLDFWIRLQTSGSLFKDDADNIDYSVSTEQGDTGMSLSFAAVSYIGAVVGEVWTQVAVSVDQVNGSVVFYQNGASTTSQTLITSHIDSPDSIKQIGVGYQGFMYSICITHSAVDTFLVDTNCEGTLGTGYAPASP